MFVMMFYRYLICLILITSFNNKKKGVRLAYVKIFSFPTWPPGVMGSHERNKKMNIFNPANEGSSLIHSWEICIQEIKGCQACIEAGEAGRSKQEIPGGLAKKEGVRAAHKTRTEDVVTRVRVTGGNQSSGSGAAAWERDGARWLTMSSTLPITKCTSNGLYSAVLGARCSVSYVIYTITMHITL